MVKDMWRSVDDEEIEELAEKVGVKLSSDTKPAAASKPAASSFSWDTPALAPAASSSTTPSRKDGGRQRELWTRAWLFYGYLISITSVPIALILSY